LQALIERALDHADSFQGRVAARGQIQVALDFPQNAKRLRLFLDWWEQGLRGWRARAADADRVVFLCELGPPDYATTDAEGRELSDRWQEALALRAHEGDLVATGVRLKATFIRRGAAGRGRPARSGR